jgi:hypothetical protein
MDHNQLEEPSPTPNIKTEMKFEANQPASIITLSLDRRLPDH